MLTSEKQTELLGICGSGAPLCGQNREMNLRKAEIQQAFLSSLGHLVLTMKIIGQNHTKAGGNVLKRGKTNHVQIVLCFIMLLTISSWGPYFGHVQMTF